MTTEVVTQFYVQGMKCEGCIAKANEAMSDLPGLVGAEFDLKQGLATVKGNVDPQAVCQVLAQAGYPAVVKSA